MSLTISLFSLSPIYSPGDTLSGTVNLTSKKSEDIAKVSIEFTGRCKVKIRRNDHYTTVSYRSRGYYFRNRLVVFDGGNYTHQVGTFSWPFSFIIPSHASQDQKIAPVTQPKRQLSSIGILEKTVDPSEMNDCFSPRRPFLASNDLRSHVLPGTFKYIHSQWPIDAEGRVEYELTATLNRPRRSVLFAAKDLEASQMIRLQTLNPLIKGKMVENLQVREIEQTFMYSRLPSSKLEGRLSLREKAQALVRPGSLPRLTATIAVLFPRRIYPGSTMSFALRIHKVTGNHGELMDTAPQIRLHRFALYLISKTNLRDNNDSAVEQTIERFDFNRHVIRSAVGSTWITSDKEIFLTDERYATFLSVLSMESEKDTFIPGFTTWNIARTYFLGFDTRLECVGKIVDMSRDDFAVEIMAVKDAEIGSSESPQVADREPPAFHDGEIEDEGIEKYKDEKRDPIQPTPERNEMEEDLPEYQEQNLPGYLPE